MDEYYWCAIDSASKCYPLLTTANSKSTYRINCVMKQEVNVEALQHALKRAIRRFPYYACRVKSGFFWHYLEHNPSPVEAYPDDGYILKKMRNNENNDYSFRLTYYKNRISLEMFHALTDANGAIEFMKCIVYCYMKELGVAVGDENVLMSTPYDEEEAEDAFIRYAKPHKLNKEELRTVSGSSSVYITGEFFRNVGFRTMEIVMPISDVIARAKANGGSVTGYILAVYVHSLARLYQQTNNKSGVQIMVPMNLRKAFPSKTMKNFVVFRRIGLTKDKLNYDFDKTVEQVNSQLASVTNEELSGQIDMVVKGMRLPLFRYLPMMLKYPIFRFAKDVTNRPRQTGILSSCGIAKLPSGMEQYIDRLSLCVNTSKYAPKNVGILTTGDKITVTVTSTIKDTLLEKAMVDRFVSDGLAVTLYSSGRDSYEMS